jgi:hypothetical protein
MADETQLVTLSLNVGPLNITRVVAAKSARRSAARLLKLAQSLRETHPEELLETVDHVPGGSVEYVDDLDYEEEMLKGQTPTMSLPKQPIGFK